MNAGTMNARVRAWILLAAALLAALALLAPAAHAARIKELCEVQGARGNALMGIGIVVGLAGTGDSVPEAVRAQQRMLQRLDIDVTSLGNLNSDNVAVVIVTATFPPFGRSGTRIDVQASSLYNCESLEGGILLNTQLSGDDGRVYAVAQGAISTGGFNAGGGGASVTRNHVTVGRVPMGAYLEREIPSTITDGERVTLLLKKPDFINASLIEQALNTYLGTPAASAFGAGSINVKVPAARQADLVQFIADIQDLDVQTPQPTRVVINERTGTIVVGGTVEVKPCQVAHGNITITVATSPVFPLAPLIGQEERQGEITDLEVIEQPAYLLPVSGTTASEVALALNKLKVTPRDLIAIFQALRESGALEADLEIM